MITNKLTKILCKSIIKKLQTHIGTNNEAELARSLNCSKQILNYLILQGKIPTNRVINFALKEGLSLDELFNNKAGVASIDT